MISLDTVRPYRLGVIDQVLPPIPDAVHDAQRNVFDGEGRRPWNAGPARSAYHDPPARRGACLIGQVAFGRGVALGIVPMDRSEIALRPV
ncbi:hypothetical protein [Nocardia neocaledoniensis]|uniref:hypothetical protein n=1 Tax=Nocardia neocaledoniensis TaxID=236511 RepID=UPI002455B2D7|nr:hypothetical protein [Nocardia neocaledoniensis]